jgi:hypothetical protein
MQRPLVDAQAAALEEWSRLWEIEAQAKTEAAVEIAALLRRGAKLMRRELDPSLPEVWPEPERAPPLDNMRDG